MAQLHKPCVSVIYLTSHKTAINDHHLTQVLWVSSLGSGSAQWFWLRLWRQESNAHQVWNNLQAWLEGEDHCKLAQTRMRSRHWKETSFFDTRTSPQTGLLQFSIYGRAAPKWGIFSWPASQRTHDCFHCLILVRDQPDIVWKGTAQGGEYKKVRILGGWLPSPFSLWTNICKMPVMRTSTSWGWWKD